MKAVTLQEQHLVEDLAQVASQQNTTPETLLNRAVSQFLYKMGLQKMRAETVAFEQMHSELVGSLLGEFVAIHNGQLIDHDPDLTQLRLRIRQQFGRMPILLRQVTLDRALHDLTFRSPRIEAMAHETKLQS